VVLFGLLIPALNIVDNNSQDNKLSTSEKLMHTKCREWCQLTAHWLWLTVAWCPGHANTPGNEYEDTLVKEVMP